jgi:hypothetical protein
MIILGKRPEGKAQAERAQATTAHAARHTRIDPIG